MKKLATVLVCLLLVAAIGVVVFATDAVQMTIVPERTTVRRGEIVEFSVNMSELSDCKSAAIFLESFYDEDVFEFVSGTCTMSDAALSNFGYVNDMLSGSFAYENGRTISGEIFTFTMKVKYDAPLGETSVGGLGSSRNSAGSVSTSVDAANVIVANNEITLIPEKTAASRGEVIEFSAVMTELVDCQSAGVILEFDEDIFEFVEGSCNLPLVTMSNFGYVNGMLGGSFAYEFAKTVSGEIFTFKMKVKEDAAFGDTQITGTGAARTSAGPVCTTVNTVDMTIAAVQMFVAPANTTAARGQIVEYTVTMSEMADCRSAGVALNYDPNHLEYIEGRCTVSGTEFDSFGIVGGITSGSFVFGTGKPVSGQIFTFKMKVKQTAPCGIVPLSVTASSRNSDGAVPTAAVVTPLTVHDWSAWQNLDARSHKRVCATCGLEELAPHAPVSDDLVAGSDTHWKACICGAKLEETAHSFDESTWLHNTDSHWHQCACGAKDHIGQHSFTEEIVDEAHLVPGSFGSEYYYDCAVCDAIGTETFNVAIRGDLDNSQVVDESDAVYLLQHVLMPDLFALNQDADFDRSGEVDEDDAIYLLQHILMPDLFPL